MAVNQPTRSELDQAIRKVDTDGRTFLDNLKVLKDFVDKFTAEELQADPWNFTQPDVDNLKAMVFAHTAVATTLNDANSGVLTFGGRLAGVNFVRR